ncbi:MAG: hypothetical protein FJ029_06565, partial [Actinobacteria bacterium]|nr:hypothetical protein [Actinomycetota bacterium]
MARTSVRVWFGVAGALALAGIADTAYLLVLAGASEAGAQCAVGGCAGVLNSPYAYTLGVSNAVWGLLAYAVVFALTALGLAGPAALRRGVPALVMVVAYVGVAAHAYFVYVQAAILREF